MKRFMVSVCVAFALGFAIAWTGKPENSLLTQVPPVAASRSASSRDGHAVVPRQSPAMDRVKGYLRIIDEAPPDSGYSSETFENIATGDIPLLIEQWKKRAGFSGLEYNEQHQIKELVKSWYTKDPDAALAWAAGMECQKDRQELIAVIVGVEAKRDFDRALELAKQYGKLELGGLDMPDEVQEKLGEFDPARFMEIINLFQTPGSGMSGSRVDFKKNFDFATLATLLDQAQADSNNERRIFFPSNLMTEWTKSDPQAAWNWISKSNGGSGVFNEAEDFFKTLANTRSKTEINTFVIAQMASLGGDNSKYKLAWHALASKPDADQTADFIARLPGDRGINLEQLAEISTVGSGGHYDEFKEILLSQMTLEERRQIVPKVYGGNNSAFHRKIMSSTLSKLGHTDAEINVMLPPPSGK